MTELLGLGVALAFMVAIYGVILGRGKRSGRVGRRDPIGQLGAPTSQTADMVLGLLAVGQLTLVFGQQLGGREGAMVGLAGGLTMGLSGVRTIFNVVGVVAGLVGAVTFVLGPGLVGAVSWRLVFVSAVVLCFVLGMMLGHMFLGRSLLAYSFGDGRGLAFFGLVELFTFFGSPGGADLLGLEPGRFGAYLGVAVVGAVGLGAAVGPLTLWVLAGALAMVTVTFGDPALSVFMICGLAVFLIAWAVLGRRLRWWKP